MSGVWKSPKAAADLSANLDGTGDSSSDLCPLGDMTRIDELKMSNGRIGIAAILRDRLCVMCLRVGGAGMPGLSKSDEISIAEFLTRRKMSAAAGKLPPCRRLYSYALRALYCFLRECAFLPTFRQMHADPHVAVG